MTTTWFPMFFLHRETRIISRPCEASTSRVVPISSTRNAMRGGVMTNALMSRPVGHGAMSPYPVVLSVTVV